MNYFEYVKTLIRCYVDFRISRPTESVQLILARKTKRSIAHLIITNAVEEKDTHPL